ncbi:MAG: GntR family transcriptional regulator [Peptococcaceae bacterium]
MICKDNSVPLHKQVEAILNDLITNKLKPDERIPSERELCKMYGLSRTTIRQAINKEVTEGNLYRIQGKGTFVAKPKIYQELFKMSSFKETIIARGMEPKVKIYSSDFLVATLQTATLLHITPEEEILKMVLVGFADAEPIVLYKSYLPANLGRLTLKEAQKYEARNEAFSSFELYKSCCDIEPYYTNQTFEAILPNDFCSEVLRISKTQPVFKVTSIIYTQDNSPIEYKEAYYRGDKFKFNISRQHTIKP